METHPKHIALLKRMFTEREWEALASDRTFRLAVHDAGDTLDDVERLAMLGERVLQASGLSAPAVRRTRNL